MAHWDFYDGFWGAVLKSANTLSSFIATDSGDVSSILSGSTTKDKTLEFNGLIRSGTVLRVEYGRTTADMTAMTVATRPQDSNWMFTTGALDDGNYKFTFKFENMAGVIVDTFESRVKVQTTVPAGFTDDGVSLKQFIDNGVTKTEVKFFVLAPPNGMVEIYEGDKLLGQAEKAVYITDDFGPPKRDYSSVFSPVTVWQFTSKDLTVGAHSLTVKVTDPVLGLVRNLDVPIFEIKDTPPPADKGIPTDHEWSKLSGWGSLDALGAMNAMLQDNGKTIIADDNGKNDVKWLAKLGSQTVNGGWGWNFHNITDVWKAGYTGKGVKVAVIDSGFAATYDPVTKTYTSTNPDMPKIDSKSRSFGADDSQINDLSEIGFSHGTFTSSEIFAKNDGKGITGVAYDAEFIALKLNFSASTSVDQHPISSAIRYAVDNGAKVISMSLGTAEPEQVDAIRYAMEKDVVVLIAAGNRGGPKSSAPAHLAQYFNNVISVGALEQGTGKSKQAFLTSFSELAGSGRFPDEWSDSGEYNYIATAGRDVAGYEGASGTVGVGAGTSMACPMTAGVAALLYSADIAIHGKITLKASDIVDYLTSTTNVVI